MNDQDSLSENSEGCQDEVRESTGGDGILKNFSGGSKNVSEGGMAIPSIEEKEMETDENFVPAEPGGLRGSNPLVNVGGCRQNVDDSALDSDISALPKVLTTGSLEGSHPLVNTPQGDLGSGLHSSIAPLSFPSGPTHVAQEGYISNTSLIDNFEKLLTMSRGKQGALILSDLSDENNNVIATTSQAPSVSQKSKSLKNKNSNPRPPFNSLVGPKCLRLVEAINGGAIPVRRRRKNTIEKVVEEGMSSSSSSSGNHNGVTGDADQSGTIAIESTLVEKGENPIEFELEVVLPISTPNPAQSGVQALLGEHSLIDVAGFLEAREDPGGKLLEAEKLVEIQKDLGVSFNPADQVPVDRLLKMEERDRVELAQCQEYHGPQ
jgi:hypothetical protein